MSSAMVDTILNVQVFVYFGLLVWLVIAKGED